MLYCCTKKQDCCFTYTFEIDQMISTNDTLMPRPRKTKSGRWTAYMAPTGEMKSFKKELSDILIEIFDEHKEKIEIIKDMIEKDYYRLYLDVSWYMPIRNYEDNDTSNYIKPYEDCIVKEIGIDDRKNVSIKLEKHPIDSKNWKVVTRIGTKLKSYEDMSILKKNKLWCERCNEFNLIKYPIGNNDYPRCCNCNNTFNVRLLQDLYIYNSETSDTINCFACLKPLKTDKMNSDDEQYEQFLRCENCGSIINMQKIKKNLII